MSLEIIPYNDDFKAEWDAFVWNSNNGTIFHTRRFLSYHPPARFEDQSLIFKKRGRVISLFPATIRHSGDLKILSSHSGASYGGFVVEQRLSIRDSFRLVEALLDFARKNDFNRIELTLPPQIYLQKSSNYLDFALLQSGFTYRKREVSSVIPLDFGVEDILNTFSPESRRSVRRGMKLGVKVQESEDYAGFYRILQKNLWMRHNVKPTHTVAELLHLKELFPDRIRLFAAQVQGKMIAGVVIFICNSKVALAFYISHDEQNQKFRAVNCLFYDIIKWSIQRGFSYLDFGIFTVNMDPNWGLARFKESFGAQGVFRDTLSFIRSVRD